MCAVFSAVTKPEIVFYAFEICSAFVNKVEGGTRGAHSEENFYLSSCMKSQQINV